MKNKFSGAFPLRRVALLLLFATLPGHSAQTTEFKFETQLIWATNDEKSPNPKHKEAGPEIRKKLQELPLKWKSYFEVNRKQFSVSKGIVTKVAMSEKCGVDVKDSDGKNVEVTLISKGERVWTRKQPLPKGEILILSGNAPDKTAWLITLKRMD